MKLSLPVSLLSLSLFAIGAAQAAPPRYRIDYLPSLGGSSTATSINDLGWVAGRSTLTSPAPSHRHAVLWRNRQITDLGTLGSPERQSAVVWPVKNVRGIIAGIAETNVIDSENEDWSCSAFLLARPAGGPRYQCLGFVWEDGHMRALPTFGGTHGFATGANNFGQVVGWAETTVRDPVGCTLPQKFQFRAALWEPRRNRIKELPPVVAAGDTVSAATAINDRGQVVGISGICDDAVGKFSAIRAVLWERGKPTVLGDIGGAAWNTPMAINPQGDVVGFGNQSLTDEGAPDWGAFLWTRHGGMRALPKLAGHLNAQANGLNLWRHAVGRSCTDASMSACDAVLWRDGGVHRLRDLIADFPADGPRLTTATDIDDFGRISGQAINPQTGAGMAYVATPIY
ncbi:hypothetical protein [Lysobacter sp. cf310]|uniref:hypothetical protein n=1 Tax=Lysobacter sp. cf310 TaxID=1761790 RepID=UPI0008ECDB7B|nr:hypothetical protein [Lysobacter sp. cf310]SFK98701.1 probable extracellular repeat, HAF family [Lysobacter sp. cf310]